MSVKILSESKPFFEISNIKSSFINSQKDLAKINGTWLDILYFNSLSNYLLSNFNNVENSYYKKDAVDYLVVLSKNFYIYFSIIYKLIEKIKKEAKNKDIDSFFVNFKLSLGKKIQIVRNEVIIHKEYKNYRDSIFSSFDTGNSGLHLFLKTKNGDFELSPFDDLEELNLCLDKLKKIVEK